MSQLIKSLSALVHHCAKAHHELYYLDRSQRNWAWVAEGFMGPRREWLRKRLLMPIILLVDDDLLLLALTAELLTELGYRVHTAKNAREALSVLGKLNLVDMLVTDVQMPRTHGFELARRARELRPELAVLYWTGHPESISDDMGPALGPILTKPCSPERMHQEIQRLSTP